MFCLLVVLVILPEPMQVIHWNLKIRLQKDV